jgi:hypothetical protein
MPPNIRAGYTMAAVMLALYLIHIFSGKHEMRKPTWDLAQKDEARDD